MRTSLKAILSVALLTIVTAITLAGQPKPDSTLVYLGTYTGAKSKGIYVTRLNLTDATLARPELAAEVPSPSFLAIHPTGKFLYCISEVDNFNGKKTGAV